MNDIPNENEISRQHELAWGLYCEVRNEIVESIKLVHQITALKATFMSGSIAVILANISDDFPYWIICLPLMSMVFFDFIIDVRRYVMFRNAFYVRETLEPILKKTAKWPPQSKMFEEFLYSDEYKYKLSPIVRWDINLAFTLIAIGILIIYEERTPAIISSAIILVSFCASLYISDPMQKRRKR